MAKGDRKVVYRVVISHHSHSTGPYKYSTEVPALPGCISYGRTRKDAIRTIKDVIRARLTPIRLRRPGKEMELVEVAVGGTRG